MSNKFGVLVFPGTWSEGDWLYALSEVMGLNAEYVFHKQTNLHEFDCLVIPGGFSYGDYLRPGAIARFSPVMGSLIKFANAGGPVVGSCNGFQVLCEAGLLPGALLSPWAGNPQADYFGLSIWRSANDERPNVVNENGLLCSQLQFLGQQFNAT